MSINAHAYVCLGSNLGDRAAHLLLAARGMMDAGLCVSRLSSIYETEPVEVTGAQPPYLNMVAEVSLAGSPPAPEEMLALLLGVEQALGRRREGFNAARTIDLDLLLYADARSDTPFLKLPHPRLASRRFVLAPLCELAPDAEHPVLRRTVRRLLDAAPGGGGVRPWQP